MKLTQKELDIVAGFDDLGRARSSECFGLVFIVVIYAVLRLSGWLRPTEIPLDHVLAIYTVIRLSLLLSSVRTPCRKVTDLLQRYINNDPEALTQIAARGAAINDPG